MSAKCETKTTTTWFKVTRYNIEIDPVEVVKESAQQVTVRSEWMGKSSDRRVAKIGQYHRYFPSRTEALEHLINRTTNSIEALRERLQDAEYDLKQLEGMSQL